MQTSMNFSSLQASYTTTHWSALGEEITKDKANSVPKNDVPTTLEEKEEGKTSSIISSSRPSFSGLGDMQKEIVSATLLKIAEIKNEILKVWEEIQNSHKGNNSVSSGNSGGLSIQDYMELILSGKLSSSKPIQIGGAQSGISITQGFHQSLELSIKGTIVGSDGVKKELDLSISLSQSFIQNIQINGGGSIGGGTGSGTGGGSNVIDPLVIDYEGNGTELSDTKMSFDLDSDGKKDQISTLKKGSGFLALDKNGDGKINDGNELFGTQSGDGFKDLSAYDSNKDGKIDKEDPIYDKLRIWSPNENGEGELVGLGEKGIGVIYLDAKENQEMMRGENGDLLGIKQKTADILFDDGRVGDIHHIDLVADKEANEPIKNGMEEILGGSLNAFATKAYIQNLSISFNFSSTWSSSLEINNGNFSLSASQSGNFNFSLSSLLSANNGVSSEFSDIWKKLEESFGNILGNKQTLEKFDEESYLSLNQLAFANLLDSPFKPLNNALIDKLLSA
ncbi:hypothetical protein B6S12_00295 [Helicobacter valdiviensis]|uniref:Haemolysin-type calcium binding-related domain-containing protein n=1 Tax=Helicobacter valdiviensis TaxID=1458358 RepID=A0A2W6MY89_9HELI|nr:hypothetical protein [Helicobacter valdiviensis]PZT49069.1 hypothetical protein B6S12_00295 [Helicobacter valdiviensis]